MEKLLQFKDLPDSLLIQDTVLQSATPFLEHFKGKIFTTENRANAISIGFKPKLNELLAQLKRESGIVVLESITLLYLLENEKIFEFLHELFENRKWQMLVLVHHCDIPLPNNDLVRLLEHYCSAHLVLKPENKLDFLWKKKSGKIKREQLAYDPVNVKVFEIPSVFAPIAPVVQKDPLEGISFNLDLTEKQKSQKDGVVLPYLEAQTPVIEYTFDEDEFDDEDPDDDLDI
jgi:hypothetical protein